MRSLVNYFHVYVFAAFFLGFAFYVAANSKAFVELIRPTVRDAVALAEGAETYLHQVNPKAAVNEVTELYVFAIRMPSKVLEHVAVTLKKAQKKSMRYR